MHNNILYKPVDVNESILSCLFKGIPTGTVNIRMMFINISFKKYLVKKKKAILSIKNIS